MDNTTESPVDSSIEPPQDLNTNKPSLWVIALLDTWGILSSIALLFLIWLRKELRYSSYMWLISNAVFVCLVACTLVTPAIIHQDLGMRTLPEGFCFVYGFMIWVVQFMVPVSLLMVLLDRIVYICDPIVYVRKMGTAVLFAMIFVPWIFAVVFAACSFLPFRGEIQQRAVEGDLDFKYCIVRLGFEYVHSRAQFVVSLYYAVPVVLLVAAIFVLMIILCHRRHCCVHHLDEFDFEFEDTRESVCRAAVPISIVSFVYLILLLPSLVILFKNMQNSEDVASTESVMWVLISFEWFQPLLWMICVIDIRHVVLRLLCCCCIQEETDSVDAYNVQAAQRKGLRQ